MKGFKDFLKKSVSERTVESYAGDVVQYLETNGIGEVLDCDAMDREKVENYISYMHGEKLSGTTINRKLSSMRRLNEYLANAYGTENYVYGNDFVRVQSKGNPTVVTNEEVEKFVNVIMHTESSMRERNIAMVSLMCNTGLRRSEVCDLKIEDIIRKGRGWIAKVNGKGNKDREVMIPKAVKSVLDIWIEKRSGSGHANSEYLFLSQRGERLRPESINHMFTYYAGLAGVKITPHSLRHNYGSTIMEKGILSIVELKNQMGHSSIDTTMIYTHARHEAMVEKTLDLNIGFNI